MGKIQAKEERQEKTVIDEEVSALRDQDAVPAKLVHSFAALGQEEGMQWLSRYPWEFLYVQKWEYLCRYREPVSSLYFLLEGQVSVSITPPHGRTHIVTFCEPGALICGDVEVALGNTLATADLRAECGVWCAALPIEEYRAKLLEDADFLRYAFRRLAREMIHDSVCAANNLLFPLDERLAAYILEASPEAVFGENLTRTAQLLGVSYRQLARVMRGFAERGWMERGGAGWRILDRAALAGFSAEIEPLPLHS
ncbi:MAG: cyclic nucleotide-binding domain-containing protein [Clostridia bacterium]|nr:cyclic nucleotide-binding domain-containing protein [Clostridia bacterium]